jgi:hypothetical protein
MRLDGDITTAAIDPGRDITGGDPFTIGVAITRATDLYEGYEWLVNFPEGIAFAGNFQNLAPNVFTVCATPTSVGLPNEIYGGCITPGPATNYVGAAGAFDFRCIANGSFLVQLTDRFQATGPFSSGLLDEKAQPLPTHTVGLTVNCSGVGSTGSTVTPVQTP